MSFIKLLIEYMEAVDLNETEFRKETNISRATLARWKNGKINRPNCDKVRTCAQLFQQRAQVLCQHAITPPITLTESHLQDLFRQLQIEVENLKKFPKLSKSQSHRTKVLSKRIKELDNIADHLSWKTQVLRMKATVLQLETKHCPTKERSQLEKKALYLKALALQLDPINPEKLLALAGCLNEADFPKPIASHHQFQLEASPLSPITSRPILHPSQFFGYESLLKRIFEGWNHPTLENVAISGPKLSGKTSLLNYLRWIHTTDIYTLRKEQKKEWLKQAFNWIFVDFKQDIRTHRLHSLLEYLSDALGCSKPFPDHLEHFIEMVEDHVQSPTIFLMDNIDHALASCEELDEDFWNCMRYLGSHGAQGKIGFCITSRQPFEQLVKIDKTSHFINVFNEFELTPFNKQEAQEFIACVCQCSEEDQQWMIEQSQAWPALLQVLCKFRMEEGEHWKAISLKYLHRKIYQELLCRLI